MLIEQGGRSFSRFEYGIKSEETRRKYTKRLELFLDFSKFEGGTVREKSDLFYKFTKENDIQKTTDVILNYMSFHISRAAEKVISKSTVRNFYKPVKLFCDMNNIAINSKIITKGIPSGSESSNDRIPTREEIMAMLKYPDRRLKAITLTMLSSGIRVGAWEYLKWKHIIPLYDKNKEIIAAKIIVYDDEPERYFSFITPEAYYELKDWMEFRSTQGEKITEESWLMRDLWNTGHILVNSKDSNLTKGISGLVTSPKKADVDSIRMIFNRAWRIQNVRNHTLDMNSKRRHEFKGTHSLRKFFETHALSHMKLLNVKLLMGHDIGLDKSYYKPTEKEILDDYLNVVHLLTISNDNKLQKSVEISLQEKEGEISNLKEAVGKLAQQNRNFFQNLQRKEEKLERLEKEFRSRINKMDKLQRVRKTVRKRNSWG